MYEVRYRTLLAGATLHGLDFDRNDRAPEIRTHCYRGCAMRLNAGSRIVYAVILLLAAGHASASSLPPYPTRSVNLIVPFAPGGATDIVARLLAKYVGDDLGQTIIVENKPGAAGNIGMELTARAAPDGYTLVLTTTTAVINQFLFRDQPFNLLTDFSDVGLFGDAPELLVVSSKVPANTLAEFITLAKAKASSGGFNYGSPGVGSVPHLAGEVLSRTIDANLVHVPFRGSSEVFTALASGDVEFSFSTLASAKSFLNGGLVRALAVTGAERLKSLPEVPTMKEAGFQNVSFSNWFGIMAPRGTDERLISLLDNAFKKAMNTSEVSNTLEKLGIQPKQEAQAQFTARLKSESASYKAVLSQIGLGVQ